jgi:predicted nucleotidyltransferase
MRSIPDSFDSQTVTSIDTLLDTIQAEHRVSISLAIESGSRAWGFPSPDSDYDCRFIYVRSSDHYLTPWPPRDVIETPLTGDLDVNGWDLAKALKLMLNGNAVILEWLQSPIVYRGKQPFRDAFITFAQRHADRNAIARHYLHLGMRQRNTYFGDGKAVALKKVFYALRPAAALRWMRLHPDASLPPMQFPLLLTECELDMALAEQVADMLLRKAATRELGSGPLPEAIRVFVDTEFETAQKAFAQRRGRTTSAAREEAAGFFRDWVTKSWLE